MTSFHRLYRCRCGRTTETIFERLLSKNQNSPALRDSLVTSKRKIETDFDFSLSFGQNKNGLNQDAAGEDASFAWLARSLTGGLLGVWIRHTHN